jgi:DNA-binding response OmpR family regulator
MAFRKRKKKVLVADDDSDFTGVVRAILEHAGFAIDTASNGEEALKAIKKQTYDLLILDVVMPKVDGIKLFRMTRKSKRYSKIPVLFISGHSNRERVMEQHKEIIDKAAGYMDKPIKTKVFIERVKSLIDE